MLRKLVSFGLKFNKFRCFSEKATPLNEIKQHDEEKKFVNIKFVIKDTNTNVAVKALEGSSIYDVVVDNNVDLDGFGACDGTLCCTTCHVQFDKKTFDKLSPPEEEELDMLDLAFDLTDTSRLGCQVIVDSKLQNENIYVPETIMDAR